MAASQPVAPPALGGGARPSRAALLAAPVRWPRPERLDLPLGELSGIGPKLGSRAAEAGVETIFDLLWRVPRAYGEIPDRVTLGRLRRGEPAIVTVELLGLRTVRVRRRGFSVIEARVADESGARKAVWFNQPWVADRLVVGHHYLLEGRLEAKGFTVAVAEPLDGPPPAGEPSGGNRVADAARPKQTVAGWGRGDPPGLMDQGIRGRHPAGESIKPARWRRWAWQATAAAGEMAEPLPAVLLGRRGLPGAVAAIREAHFPVTATRSDQAVRRLAYEELFLHQVVLRRGRVELRRETDPPPALDAGRSGAAVVSDWECGLPFELTADQVRAMAEIDADLGSGHPMRRLLMGEVGAGKTVVAVRAMLGAHVAGAQSAIMAPTEVLAEQHAVTVRRLLAGTGVRVELLTGSVPASRRGAILADLVAGEVDIVVGTHALLEDDVAFRRLALAVVDEEHRFGVSQRARLAGKAPSGHSAHFLQMTATPIPRTLSLTAYGDLDVTALHQLPADRKPVETVLATGTDREAVFGRLKGEVSRGRQAFVVCPLVEGSDDLGARAAAAEAERLRDGELREFEVGLVHGQMNAARKELAMSAFAEGRTDVLVATTVVEVGIDVPNATVMVIEGAERYGLSQLHQLRGRVGRGRHGGTCFLIAAAAGPRARRRLAAVAGESDGFRLAEIDLELRGEGEITGTRQHGLPRFRVADLPRDAELLEQARDDLDRLLELHGGLDSPALSPLSELAGSRFGPEGIRR
ncbi:MAG: ATP-dependent DNA helicase RecG [Solirubrobacterales bacterium]|nr:ATP-dependent DNA helicase RecG [Solirubrobacterales bacterium]